MNSRLLALTLLLAAALSMPLLSACGAQPAAAPAAPAAATAAPADEPPSAIPTAPPSATPEPTLAGPPVLASPTPEPLLENPGWILVGRLEHDGYPGIYEFGPRFKNELCPAGSKEGCVADEDTEAVKQAIIDFLGGATWRFYDTPGSQFDPEPHVVVITPGSAEMQALFGEVKGKYGYIDPMGEGRQDLVRVVLNASNPETGAAISLSTEIAFSNKNNNIPTMQIGVGFIIPEGDSERHMSGTGIQIIESVSGPLAEERLGK